MEVAVEAAVEALAAAGAWWTRYWRLGRALTLRRERANPYPNSDQTLPFTPTLTLALTLTVALVLTLALALALALTLTLTPNLVLT